MATIYSLSELTIALVLEYLKAVDLARVGQVCKLLFCAERISDIVQSQITAIYSKFHSMKIEHLRLVPGVLYVYEIKATLAALAAAQPIDMTGYWVSTTWLSNTKKYFESRHLPNTEEYSIIPTRNRAKVKSVSRKSSHAVSRDHPTLNMVQDIACGHGCLAPSHIAKSKRRLIAPRVFHFLRKTFFQGQTYRASEEPCIICNAAAQPGSKTPTPAERNEQKSLRKLLLVPESLESLSARRTGVPNSALSDLWGSQRDSTAIPMDNVASTESSIMVSPHESISSSQSSIHEIVSCGSSSPESTIVSPQKISQFSWSHVVKASTPATTFTTPVRTNLAMCSTARNWSEEQEAIELAMALSLSIEDAAEPVDTGDALYDDPARQSIVPDQAFKSNGSSFVSSARGWTNDPTTTKISRSATHNPISQPLVPGIYHVIPRSWIKSWRQLARNTDKSLQQLRPLDCTSLLCNSHGNLIIPPHLEEYLAGFRRNLLANLTDYPTGGEIVEVVSVEEWDALQAMLLAHFPAATGCDFNIRFCLDGSHVSWNIDVCRQCDPYNYQGCLPKPGPNSQRKWA